MCYERRRAEACVWKRVSAEITSDFSRSRVFFANRAIHTKKETQKRKLTIFGNSKQVIQTTTQYLTIRFSSAKIGTWGHGATLGPTSIGTLYLNYLIFTAKLKVPKLRGNHQ